MPSREEILRLLRERRDEMYVRFSVRGIGLFGSFARDATTDKSDIDLLVELEKPTFDHYMDLKFYLEELFCRSVDLVLSDTVKPRLIPHILREVAYA
jgi:hypothetical protein